MAEIIDINTIPRRTCQNCLWNDAPHGACKRPGGYDFDLKRWRCRSFQWKDPPDRKEGKPDGG